MGLVSLTQMVELHVIEAPEPSPKLSIVAIGTHGNNGGAEIAIFHLLAHPWLMNGHKG